MIVKNLTKDGNSVKFDVELTAEEFEKYVSEAYKKNRGRITVPGFRKGKAPRMVIEGMYGAGIFHEEAAENAANDAFAFAVEQEGLRAVGRPGFSNYEVADDKSAVLSFLTDVWPVVKLGQYKGLEAEKETVSVSESEIDEEIERLRKQNARMVSVDRPAENGDTVNIDYAGTRDGAAFEGGSAEKYDLKLGSGSFIPGFEEKLVGISANEERDLELTFPEDYHAAELAGKAVVFHVRCNDVKYEELPELDDEFAKDNDFDTLDLLRADIRSRRESARETAAQNAFTDALIEEAAANMEADIPASMIEEKIDSIVKEYANYMSQQGIRLEDYLKIMGGNLASFRESNRATAERQARTEVLLGAVADAEGIEISEDDLKAEYQSMADAYGLKPEDVEKYVDAGLLTEDLKRRKAIELITSSGVATEPKEKKEIRKPGEGSED